MLRSSTDKTVCYVANWIVGIYDSRVRAPFHESNIRLYKTKIMTKNKTS